MSQIGGTQVAAVPAVPVGSLQAYAGSSAPTGWLLCDGSAVSRSAYSNLFSTIGTTFGTGDGSTTFNVPDMRGRHPVGAGTGAGQGATGTGAPSGTALTARSLGAYGGDERLHAHSHVATDSGHSHIVYRQGFVGDGSGNGGALAWDSRIDYNSNSQSGVASANITVSNNTQGGVSQNMSPFIVTNYIIKALPDTPRGGLTATYTPPIVTTLPASPTFGDQVVYAADATNGVYWLLQYDASGTYPWKFIGGAPLYSSFGGGYAVSELGPTSTYVQTLASSPVITCPLPGDYRARASAIGKPNNTSPAPGIWIAFAGATASAWNYADSMSSNQGSGSVSPLSAIKTGTITAASQTIALNYLNANTGGTCTFYSVQLEATPIRVKAA